jgi:hypothetical protein
MVSYNHTLGEKDEKITYLSQEYDKFKNLNTELQD